jgi:hypothetical protein
VQALVDTGGIIGALVGSGIPEERAKLYEQGVKDGHIVMGVHPRNDEDSRYFENGALIAEKNTKWSLTISF